MGTSQEFRSTHSTEGMFSFKCTFMDHSKINYHHIIMKGTKNIMARGLSFSITVAATPRQVVVRRTVNKNETPYLQD